MVDISATASTTVAEVRIWDTRVGALEFNPRTQISGFEYDPAWLRSGIEISPLKLPLQPGVFSFPRLNYDTFKGLPGTFADTLPDDFGNAVINSWLARQGRDAASFTPLERLLYTGKRGMGALEYAPAIDTRKKGSQSLQLDALVQMAQKVLDARSQVAEHFDDEMSEQAMAAILQVGTSAGGARPKAVIGINSDMTEIRSGQVALPDGFEHYLIKFDGVVESSRSQQTFGDPQGFGRMEYAYYFMATSAGINMEHCMLLPDGPRAHFLTKRFDRVNNEKLHFQSLCAIAHADYKVPGGYSYEELLSVMRQLRLGRKDAIQLFRRMVFNVVARNHDDHTKNFGFVMNQEGQWRLSPAFDIAYSYKPNSEWVSQHQLSINGKRDNFTREDLLSVAPESLMSRSDANSIIDEVIDQVRDWPKFAKQAGVDNDFARVIGDHHRLEI